MQRLKNENGEDQVIDMLIILITELDSFFNVQRSMNANQISQTADLIFECYPFYTPDDIVLCFKNIKRLKYGKIFEGLDGGKILSFISDYDSERDEEIIRIRIEESNKFKASMKISTNDTGMVKLLEMFKKKDEIMKEKIAIEKTENEKFTDFFINEFDQIHKDKHSNQSGLRFITYKGKNIDIQEYCKLRFEEENNE